MSKSKEGIDQNKAASDPQTGSDVNQPTTDEVDRKLGARGQTDYTSGQESSRDFPRRSTSNRYRNEMSQQSSYNPERANLYNQQQRTGFAQPGRYENRDLQREDTGDRYSRGTRQRRRGSEAERQRMRGGNFEQNRQYNDPYRTYDRSGQSYDNQNANWQQNQSDYRTQNTNWQQNQQGFRNPQGNQPYGRQSTTRDFGTPNYGSPEYRSQDVRSQNYGPQSDDRQTYGSPSYNPRNYNTERTYENPRDFSREDQESWNERDQAGYDREAQYGRGNDYLGSPMGFDMPYYDANVAGYNWQGQPYYRQTLRCRDIMTKDVTCCSPNATIRAVAEQMEDDNVGSIPVVENGRLVGIVTDRDIVCRVLAEGKDSRSTAAREVMTDDIVTCAPDESVMEAIHKMSEHQIRRIPICDLNGRLRGIISIGDIALEAERDRDLACAIEKISEPTPYQSRRR